MPADERRTQIASLTGMRGFAALMVVVIHSAGRTDFPGFGVHGYGPVALFTLSGFLLFRPWSRWGLRLAQRPSVRSFALRRLMRIFPAYLVVVLAVAVIYPPSQPRGADGWLRTLTLTHIYSANGLRPSMEQTWSLGTELAWYAALPVIGIAAALIAHRFSPKSGFWAVTILLSLSLPVTAVWRWWIHIEDLGRHFTYPFWLPAFALCFAGGALIAHILEGERAGVMAFRPLRRAAENRWLLIALAVVVTLVGASSLGGPALYVPSTFTERQVRFGCSTMLALILLVGAVFSSRETPLIRFFAARTMNAIGRWSYGIYLWHLPVTVLLEDEFTLRTGVGGFLLWQACILAVSIPLGAATYAWVEKPTIAWSRSRFSAGG